MSLLIHATLQVNGDAELLAAFRQQLNAALSEDYPDAAYTEMHRPEALHYDLRTAIGIPFPALIAASQEFPDLTLRVRWVNPEVGARGAADIKAGRIESQSADPLDKSSTGRQAGYVAVRADGTLRVAFALFSVRNDGCVGYVITADKDALFAIHKAGDKVTLLLAEGEQPEWNAGWDYDLASGERRPLDAATSVPIGESDYRKWREYAEAFMADWFWLEADALDATVVERQRAVEHNLPIRPANLRYEKLKSLRNRAASASEPYEVDHLGDGQRYVLGILTACFADDHSSS